MLENILTNVTNGNVPELETELHSLHSNVNNVSGLSTSKSFSI